LDGNGFITASEIGKAMKALGEDIPGYQVRNIIDEADKDENGKIDFNEFLKVSVKLFSSTFFVRGRRNQNWNSCEDVSC